jgi:hypothetical protein
MWCGWGDNSFHISFKFQDAATPAVGKWGNWWNMTSDICEKILLSNITDSGGGGYWAERLGACVRRERGSPRFSDAAQFTAD